VLLLKRLFVLKPTADRSARQLLQCLAMQQIT
jgi:hypothetical protein